MNIRDKHRYEQPYAVSVTWKGGNTFYKFRTVLARRNFIRRLKRNHGRDILGMRVFTLKY